MDSLISSHWTVMGEVDRAHRVKLVVDEWGSWYAPGTEPFPEALLGQQNTMRDAVLAGMTLDIFHRHESMAGHGEVLFSMANGVKPGTFDLDDIDLFTTRAVSFFLGLPGPRHPKQAFDVMIAAARKLAHELDGELKDDQRSVMTAQTIEHYRQRITDFERRHLTKQR